MGDAQHLGRFCHRTPKEVPQLHNLSLTRCFFRELIQRLVHRQHFKRVPSVRRSHVIQVRILVQTTAPAFATSLAAGTIHQGACAALVSLIARS